MSDTPRTEFLREKIKKNSAPNEAGCWIWGRAINSRGYGSFWDGARLTVAHRISYEAFNGTIPQGYYVCHHCDVKSCVNPEHLFAGKPSENLIDAYRKNRRASLSTEQIAELRSLVVAGVKHAEIAKRLGISKALVHYYTKGAEACPSCEHLSCELAEARVSREELLGSKESVLHWAIRAEKAEAEVEALKADAERLRAELNYAMKLMFDISPPEQGQGARPVKEIIDRARAAISAAKEGK